jgi:NAD(P)-dependent dehydrogenase (short-subunit alcohol dehydrogenase family)
MKPKSALVIGATSGIGHGIARSLAKKGCNVTISGRSAARGAEIVEELKQLSEAASHKDLTFQFVPCDSVLIKNIKNMTDEYQANNKSLDMLIFTQGVASIQGRTETEEGIDEKLALHYYGRFAFIKFLLPLLRSTEGNPRVMSVFSAGVHRPYELCLTDPALKTNYNLQNAANAAGFYNDIAVDMFSRQPENKSITFMHTAPGFVGTNWGTQLPTWLRWPVRFIQKFARTIDDSGEMHVVPLLDPATKPGYQLIDYSRSAKGKEASKTSLHNDETAQFIWNHSNKVIDQVVNPK